MPHLPRPNPYSAILRLPGAAGFTAAGAIARLPMSMVGIAIVLMMQGLHGSYALGGRVSAVYLVTQAVCSPQIARLVDTRGQSRIMRPLVLATALAMLGLIAAAVGGSPEPWLWLLAMLVGGTIGSVGALTRARWAKILGNSPALHTAFSLESAIDELIFVVGPVLATALATSVHPAAGLVVPALAAGFGGWWFLAQRGTEPPPMVRAPGAARPPTVLRNPAVVALVIIFIAVGVFFGSVDVSAIAFAEEHSHKSVAGLLLGVFAFGSLLSGLAYGVRHWRSSPISRMAVATGVLAAGAAVFLTATSLIMLAAVMFVTGFAIAPTLITGNSMVQVVVAENQLTEGLTWLGTALAIGVSAGTAVAGTLIDDHGAHAGFEMTVVAALTAFGLSLAALTLGRARRRRGPRRRLPA